jgi:hypothetical protein
MAKERRLGQRQEGPRQGRHEDQGVDERVPMIRYDHEGAGARHPLPSHHVDAVIEEPHQRAGERAHQRGPRARPLRLPASGAPLDGHRGWCASVRSETA